MEIERYPATQTSLIVSIDRRMSDRDLEECVDLAIMFKNSGRRVVGIDVCGDPEKGDMQIFTKHILRAKQAGLGLTVHIAEVRDLYYICITYEDQRGVQTKQNTAEESKILLGWRPDRLGHATFLSDQLKNEFFADPLQRDTGTMYKPCIEICLSSNLMWDKAQMSTSYRTQLFFQRQNCTFPRCASYPRLSKE
jgi:adenosine deaminase